MWTKVINDTGTRKVSFFVDLPAEFGAIAVVPDLHFTHISQQAFFDNVLDSPVVAVITPVLVDT